MATYRVDFSIPPDLELDRALDGDPTHESGELLQRLEAALDADIRWGVSRVTVLAPWSDPDRPHLIVWVSIGDPEAETVLRGGLTELVAASIPGAAIVAIQEAHR
jgi:hypothetical protein